MPGLAPDFDPATTASTRQTQSQVGLYVQDQMKIDHWGASLLLARAGADSTE